MKRKSLTKVLFLIYLLVITWIIVFKMHFGIFEGTRSVNLIPFGGSLVINGRVDISEIIMNIVIFIPFGLYLSMLRENWGFIKKVVPIFVTSLLFEIVQYVLAIGSSDITDLIGNTLGGAIGIGLFLILSKMFKNRTIKILNILSGIATVLVVAFLGLLIVTTAAYLPAAVG